MMRNEDMKEKREHRRKGHPKNPRQGRQDRFHWEVVVGFLFVCLFLKKIKCGENAVKTLSTVILISLPVRCAFLRLVFVALGSTNFFLVL